MTRLTWEAPFLHPRTHMFPSYMRRHAYLWQTYLPQSQHPLDAGFLCDHPWVGTMEFVDQLDGFALRLIDQSQPFLQQTQHPQWGDVPPADVVCVDVAVTQDAQGSWQLTPVELQAFTSIFATCHLVYDMQQALYDLKGLSMGGLSRTDDGSHWAQSLQPWLAGERAKGDVVVIEHHPWQQGTLFDMEALSLQLNAPLLHWQEVTRAGDGLFYMHQGQQRRIGHIINRCIVHELTPEEQQQFVARFAQADCTWHSHPAWYDLLNKSALMHMHQNNGQPYYVPASSWAQAPWPLEQMVLKQQHSCGGKDVVLHVTREMLEQLEQPQDWMIGERYRSYSLSPTHHLAMEARMVVLLHPQPFIAWRMTRTFGGSKASRTHLTGGLGEGFGLLWRPVQ